MKTIIATTIALLTATSVSAANWNTTNSAQWNGNSSTYNTPGCKYKDQRSFPPRKPPRVH